MFEELSAVSYSRENIILNQDEKPWPM